jgi:hypothetical protein
MVARRSQAFTTEHWNGFWGMDARYWARRSDGACFAIDGRATVFDLASDSMPERHSEPVATLPRAGRYAMRVLIAKPVPGARTARTFACGVRRRIAR